MLCLGAGVGARESVSEQLVLVSTWPGRLTFGSEVYATITDISHPLSGEEVRIFSAVLSLPMLDPDFVELHDSVGVSLQGWAGLDSDTHFK
jgi:hypothetical protein